MNLSDPLDLLPAYVNMSVARHDRERAAAGLPSIAENMSTERWLNMPADEYVAEQRREAEFYVK